MANEVILEAQGLTKEFKGFVAVKNVNLNVRRHTIHALIGPNGAGKTTIVDAVTGLVKPAAGSVRFAGLDSASAQKAPSCTLQCTSGLAVRSVMFRYQDGCCGAPAKEATTTRCPLSSIQYGNATLCSLPDLRPTVRSRS